MKKFFYLVAMATVMMTSCSKSDEMTIENGVEDLKIKFGSSTMSVEAKTRGVITAGEQIAGLQIVNAPDYSGTADWTDAEIKSNTIATANVSSTGDLTNLSKSFYYNVDKTKYSTFTAYYPAATTFTDATGSAAPIASWTIDGKTDVIVNTDGNVSGTKTNATTNTTLDFELAHKLLQLRFFLVAQNSGAITQWGNVTAIEVVETPTTASFTLPAGAVIYTNNGEVDVYGVGSDVLLPTTTLTTSKTEQGYALVAPSTTQNSDSKFTYKLKVYTTNHTTGEDVTIVLDNTSKAGDSYEITLTFKATEIQFTAALADWVTLNNVGSGDVE